MLRMYFKPTLEYFPSFDVRNDSLRQLEGGGAQAAPVSSVQGST